MENKCVWCKFVNKCNSNDCDFKNLPYEEKAIKKRIKKEYKQIESLKKQLEENHSEKVFIDVMYEMMDKKYGIDLMMERLVIDFKGKKKDLEKELGLPQLGFVEKQKLKLKVLQYKFARKTKKQ